jgi:peptidoglycan-associated lipoprotein
MKLASSKLCLAVAGAALLLAGCTKKPDRPAPNQTVLGPQTGGPNIANPTDVPVNIDAPGLSARPEGFNEMGQNRTALQPVYFDFDRFDIKAGEREKLKAAKDYLDKNPTYRLLLEGHCDWHGTAEYNLGLGDRRANAAKKYLQSLGVAADKLETLSKGSLEAVKEGGEAQWMKDRRVDLVVLNPAITPAPGMPAAGMPAGAPAPAAGNKMPGAL